MNSTNKSKEILEEVRKVIVGKDDIILKVLNAILAKGNVLIEDVPGVGKTTLALAFSKVLGLDYKRIQFTPDTMPSDVSGFSIYNKAKACFEFQAGPVMTNILLADEINRTSSKTQAALLEVMEENNVTVDGTTYTMPSPFIVLATQNPVGSAGTQMLPSSQLDRFMIKISMGYPDFKSQVNILKERHCVNPLDTACQVVSKDEVILMQNSVSEVFISDEIYEYITRLSEATRLNKNIELGLSPRGALALCRFAKGYAYINGKNFVTPQDVKDVFFDVVAHRVILSRKARLSETSVKDIIDEILDSTDMPEIAINYGDKL